MLRTALCDVLEIELPVVQAAIWPATSSELVAAVGPIPVLAAGGVADGRGLAAALVLGAQGANVAPRLRGGRDR